MQDFRVSDGYYPTSATSRASRPTRSGCRRGTRRGSASSSRARASGGGHGSSPGAGCAGAPCATPSTTTPGATVSCGGSPASRAPSATGCSRRSGWGTR
jgi:hypothetical protein